MSELRLVFDPFSTPCFDSEGQRACDLGRLTGHWRNAEAGVLDGQLLKTHRESLTNGFEHCHPKDEDNCRGPKKPPEALASLQEILTALI